MARHAQDSGTWAWGKSSCHLQGLQGTAGLREGRVAHGRHGRHGRRVQKAWAGAWAAAEVEFESISCADGSVIGLRIFMPSGDLVEAEV